jgi:hypothetical protein
MIAMLFLMTGAGGSGKTTSLERLGDLVPRAARHDYDAIDIPESATPAWRVEDDQIWPGRALEYQTQGRDVLLAGQTPLGELLACPREIELDGIAAG